MADRLWSFLARRLASSERMQTWLKKRAFSTPYFDITYRDGRPYMRRWWVLPKWCLEYDPQGVLQLKSWMPFSIRLHYIMLPDEDPHLHDHPFSFRTLLLAGHYIEQDIMGNFKRVSAGETYESVAERFHRIDKIHEKGVWSLFIIGPHIHTWGFLVGERKIFWREYLKSIGRDGATMG